jgi:superfamily II DNA or RNA helicase
LKIFHGKTEFIPALNEGMDFIGKLREEQIPIVNQVLDTYKKQGYVNGIIKARPGIGKTVMSIYLAAKLGMKTLIIIDNSNLLKQWCRAAYDFSNFNESKIGIIRGTATNIDRPFIVGMAQTLLSRIKKNMSKTIEVIDRAKIGLIIYDEVHSTSSAPLFSKISLLFRTKNILGLSATPFHVGAPELLMKNTIGEIISDTKRYDIKPTYKLVYYKSNLSSKEIFILNKINDYLTRKAIYNKLIVNSQSYLQTILENTQKLIKDNHRIMILCFTKKQVLAISELLDRNNIVNKKFYGDERDIEYNENIIITTYSYAGKGFDYKELSALIIACPLAGKKSLIQVIGRILRSCDGKTSATVIDLIDMSVPSFSIKEVHMKQSIITKEFRCDIIHEEIK